LIFLPEYPTYSWCASTRFHLSPFPSSFAGRGGSICKAMKLKFRVYNSVKQSSRNNSIRKYSLIFQMNTCSAKNGKA
jgi:hypothetical protein